MDPADPKQTLSLLEQAVLYNQSKRNPFLGPPDAMDTKRASSETAGSSSAHATPATVDKDLVPAFSSIDLNFNAPVASERNTMVATTPINRSAQRRIVHKPAKHGRICLCSSCKSSRSQRDRPVPCVAQYDKPVADASPRTFHQFMLLSGEIRDLIYDHLFTKSRIYIQRGWSRVYKLDLNYNIRFTCKKIYSETHRPFFRNFSMTVDLSDEGHVYDVVGRLVAEGILSNLESLTISVFEREEPEIKLDRFTSLRRLKVIEFQQKCNTRLQFEAAVEAHTEVMKSMFVLPMTASSCWFQKLIDKPNRTYLVEHESELWAEYKENRGQHMGLLKRECYPVVVLASSEATRGVASKGGELTASETIALYDFVEIDNRPISHRGNRIDIWHQMKSMKYHEALDRFEAAKRPS